MRPKLQFFMESAFPFTPHIAVQQSPGMACSKVLKPPRVAMTLLIISHTFVTA